jgi:biotin--protein ligase
VLGVLPSPLLSLASHQISARGRGQNTWVAPHGCLQMSLRIRPPPNVRVPRLVFVQYLFGLAVVEACREVMGEAGEQVRLKWPNDIYAVTRTSNGEELKKIGGVLVSNNFSGGQADLIIGEFIIF